MMHDYLPPPPPQGMHMVERGCLPKTNCAGLPISECEERHKKLVEDAGGKVCSCPRTNDGSTVLVYACATPKCNDLSARRPNINDCMKREQLLYQQWRNHYYHGRCTNLLLCLRLSLIKKSELHVYEGKIT